MKWVANSMSGRSASENSPASAHAEKDGTFTNTNRQVQLARQVVPPPGEAYWYLVRGEIGTTTLSWDSAGSGQTASRDAAILASGLACP